MTEHPITGSHYRPDASRLPQLDVLRGIAVLLVITRHLSFGYADAGRLAPLVKIGFDFGWTGVDLFFVLSGFLVGGLLFKEWKQRSSLDVGRFLIRRGFKIWPAYFIYVAAMTVLYSFDGSLGTPRQVLAQFLPNFVHLQSYVPTPLLHTWSLSVEEHFYLALPLILLLASNGCNERRRSSRIVLLAACGIVALLAAAYYALHSFFSLAAFPAEMQPYLRPYFQPVFLWLLGSQMLGLLALVALLPRIWKPGARNLPALPSVAAGVLVLCFAFRLCNQWLSARLGIDWTFIFFATHLRIDSLFFGVLLGYWHHFRQQRLRRAAQHRAALCVAGLALITAAIYFPWPFVSSYYGLAFNLLYLGYGCLLLAAVYTPLGIGWLGRALSSLPARGLAFIGYYSYSIYLWHISVARNRMDRWIFERLGVWLPAEPRWLATTFVSVGVAIGVGVLMAQVVEQPFLRLRDRVFPSRAVPLGNLSSDPAALPVSHSNL